MRSVSVSLITLAIALVLAMAGCTDGGDEASPGPNATPTANGNGGEEATTVSGGSVVDAVVAYVTQTGLDGETLKVTDPINCRAFVEPPEIEEATGKVCIDFAEAEFTDVDGVIGVEVFNTEASWQLKLELQNLRWVVTGAEYTGQ